MTDAFPFAAAASILHPAAMSEGGLFQTFIYLLAAVVSVPVAKRLGLGSVLGYLIAGAAIGPAMMGLTGRDGSHARDVMHFAEFGVVVMLFLIGLELRPTRLWALRVSVLGMGGLQVGMTAATVMLAALAFGIGWRTGVAAGLILAMSSTAIVLQSLGEKGLLKTPGGEASFAVLLFQDLSVIPILAVLPLLAPGGGQTPDANDAHSVAGMIDALPGWAKALVTLGAVAAVVLGGRYALRPLFRYIARTELREMFTATALGLVVGIALLMESVGLSAALGTFLAGVVLADSEYRHQLEADLEPFKGLLLGLFFISVGAGINFGFVARHAGLAIALVAGLLTIKFVVLLALGRAFRLRTDDNFLLAFALAQGGEFAFVLITFCVGARVLDADTANALTAAVALSMAVTPLLLVANDRLSRWRTAHAIAALTPATERPADTVDQRDMGGVILAGFGRFGTVVGRLLQANNVPVTILDHDGDWVDTIRGFGMKAYYGDVLREDLLRSAGVEKARLFLIAIDNADKSLELVGRLQTDFPHLKIFARAADRTHAYRLMRAGLDASHVYREMQGSALEMSADALREMGFRATQASRAIELFREYEARSMLALAEIFDGDKELYRSTARQHIQNLENLLRADADRAWNAAPQTELQPDGVNKDGA